MTRGTRRALALLGFALAVGAGGSWLAFASAQRDDEGWTRVERGELLLGVEVGGALRAVETSVLGPPQLRQLWEFKIARLAPEGTEVEPGEMLVAFDTSELEQRLQRQQAELEQASKEIDRTRKNLEMERRQDDLRVAEAQARQRKARLKVDRPGELSRAIELADARLDLELADAELAYLGRRAEASARAAAAALAALEAQRDRAAGEVEEIRAAIDSMTRRAPRAGTVIHVANWRDEKKKVGDSCWKGEQVVELPDLARMKAEGEVAEADAGRVEVNQPVRLRLDAHPDVELSGRVASIGRTVQRKSWRDKLKVVRLEIELDATDRRRMRPGMRFRGEVILEHVPDAVLLPLEAVRPTADGPRVQRRTWRGHEELPVELGRRNDAFVEVLAGVAPGDAVSLVDRSPG